ncbi:uncharacterized protein G2W53_041259 [Senna tora]|uniref:Uncharacterized protein n=1 Tax=Senna tora TaxID=362788 RepID=A0A834SEJ6_9FABA|nr:uncharacterized protein G2W53_041259 [Senna tora]
MERSSTPPVAVSSGRAAYKEHVYHNAQT